MELPISTCFGQHLPHCPCMISGKVLDPIHLQTPQTRVPLAGLDKSGDRDWSSVLEERLQGTLLRMADARWAQ